MVTVASFGEEMATSLGIWDGGGLSNHQFELERFLLCVGERNGNPLQYSCLENPMDKGAWWATSMGSQRVGHKWVTEPLLCAWINFSDENVIHSCKKKESDFLDTLLTNNGCARGLFIGRPALGGISAAQPTFFPSAQCDVSFSC